MNPAFLTLPQVQTDWKSLKLPEFQYTEWKSGFGLYQIQTNKKGLCSMEIVFRNGRCSEHKKLVARLTANQLQEGTLKLHSEEVADIIDFYGAQLAIFADLDFTVISMSCLQKHFEYLALFICDLIANPAFREEDLNRAKKVLKSQLQHQLTEPDYVSYREFTSLIYGRDSVYGYNTQTDLIDDVKPADLFRYQQENYIADYMNVFYCGELNAKTDRLFQKIGELFPLKNKGPISIPDHASPERLIKQIPIANCAQSSLKMGKRMFRKQDPDFFGMYVLNTILGDYFGSRLMKNIREDKGYTYDIHSTLDAQVYDGCFYISAELNPEKMQDAIHNIQQELILLQERKIPKPELELVRNYLCGNIMRLLDGPFQTMVFIKILVTEYGSTASLEELMDAILTVDSEKLKGLGQRYLNPETMSLVTAGAV